MLLVTRVDSRRVYLLGVAGLVPAALVTLLLVHQPSIGARRVYPMLRGSLALVGLVLALATLMTWVTAPNRLSRSSLSGLAWAGVTVLLCIGPFLESSPRARLYALELETGRVVWATSRVAGASELVDGVLVVTDVTARELVGLDPATGREMWRRRIVDVDMNSSPATPAADTDEDVSVLLLLPGERVLASAQSGDRAYAYVSTPGADGRPGGAIVKFDADDGDVQWRMALPELVAVTTGSPAIGASDDAVVVAGGERIGVLDAEDGQLRWTQSVVSLGKSRGYALPGAVQRVIVWDHLVFLSATPDGVTSGVD